ncbi:hypothetical protein [Pedobacter namyangjuensis]|uniref:hypothetical protein n=1 Tax=Pedobacter namyangjuensis TaxID=600626 RepID=UPI000DE50E09|nr:hypothetical protein [Pedobacter namyangjuensis]
MKKSSYLLLSIFVFLATLSACTKEEINAKELVQQKILGRWPVRYIIGSTYHNDILKTRDTLNRGLQVDTLVFDANGTVVKRYTAVLTTDTYSIDETASTITFNEAPLTKKISFVRANSIGFSTETTRDSGSVKIKTVTEEQLIR